MHKTEAGDQKRAEVLEYLHAYQKEHGYLPSMRSVAAQVGIRPNTLRWHIEKLREEGKVTYKDESMARSLKLKGKP